MILALAWVCWNIDLSIWDKIRLWHLTSTCGSTNKGWGFWRDWFLSSSTHRWFTPCCQTTISNQSLISLSHSCSSLFKTSVSFAWKSFAIYCSNLWNVIIPQMRNFFLYVFIFPFLFHVNLIFKSFKYIFLLTLEFGIFNFHWLLTLYQFKLNWTSNPI